MGAPLSIPPAEENASGQARLAQGWKDLFDASPDAQLICRGDGVIEHVNPPAARLLHSLSATGPAGFNAPPPIGRSLLECVADPARRAELEFAFNDVLRTRSLREELFHSHDGRFWLLKISAWVQGDDVRGLVCTLGDQTHYHELQNQLFQAQKMEIIGTLAAGIAHDFNNLLHAIRGNTSLVLLQAPPDSDLRHWAEQIHVAADRATDITQQLLSFSREAGEQRAVLDLNHVIHEAGQLVRRILRVNVTLDLIPFNEPIPVKVDSTRASQALLNLCVNGQDAMPQGGRLTITNNVVMITASQAVRHSVGEPRMFACCNVTDSGLGISAELLPHIFEPFVTTKEKGKGAGVGLPIVRRVVQEAGGFVEVDSVAGIGTTFHLYLPLAAEGVAVAPARSRLPLSRGAGRVLIVDDLDLLRDFTQTFLQAAGLTVLVAGSGSEALKILEESTEPIDLLFTDYSMPEMNGVELIERVAVRWPSVRLVLASGFLDPGARQRLNALRVNVLAKPYELHDAAALIVRLLPQTAVFLSEFRRSS